MRFFLYATNGQTTPSEPLLRMGYVDISRIESTVRTEVKSNHGVTVLSYETSSIATSSSDGLYSSGHFVANQLETEFVLRSTLSKSGYASVYWRTDIQSRGLSSEVLITATANGLVLGASLRAGPRLIRIAGLMTDIGSDLDVSVGGKPFARVRQLAGSTPVTVVEDLSGAALSSGETDLIVDVLRLSLRALEMPSALHITLTSVLE